ncbi:hypothetical protein [Lysinibacillus sp. FSL P4-0201]|uniref:hypothetical protein n=1 Tax=Lysinibacillus sp. FSL P4-0201 TaxID=2921721 RepID=UPI00315AD85B
MINENFLVKSQQLDSVKITNKLLNLGEIDWPASFDLQYTKGTVGSKLLANDIKIV